jgi:hypothetical protein
MTICAILAVAGSERLQLGVHRRQLISSQTARRPTPDWVDLRGTRSLEFVDPGYSK